MTWIITIILVVLGIYFILLWISNSDNDTE